MKYEWDERKNASNFKKHGLYLADGVAVLTDEHRIEFKDSRFDYGETRIITIGRLMDEVIAVAVHTDRDGATRIISVRKANRKERTVYYGHN
jgi:Uncharacterized protein conserved in bacteria